MKKLTIHKDLIMLLKSLNLNKELILLIMQACESEENALKMLNYLIDLKEKNETPTEEILLKKVACMAED